MSEWEPIETAPKDGTEIIGVDIGRATFIPRRQLLTASAACWLVVGLILWSV